MLLLAPPTMQQTLAFVDATLDMLALITKPEGQVSLPGVGAGAKVAPHVAWRWQQVSLVGGVAFTAVRLRSRPKAPQSNG